MAIVISAVDVFYFKQELRAKLLDAKVEQIYQHDATSITMRFYKNGVGKIDLFIAPPRGLYVTTHKPASSEELFGFCGILRKYLPSANLVAIDQVGFSRTLRFDFKFRESKFSLIVELYDKGNIILLDSEDKILAPMQVQRWEHRTIAAGQQYSPLISRFPQDYSKTEIETLVEDATSKLTPNSKSNSAANSKQMSKSTANSSDEMTTSKFATTKFNLGASYGAVLCAIAQVSPNEKITKELALKLHDQLKVLFAQEFSPNIVLGVDEESKTIKKIFPFSHPSLGLLETVPSLSSVYEQTLLLHDKPVVDIKTKASSAAQKKFQNILAAQQASISQLEAEVQENQQIGTYMYENHAHFEELLAKINAAINAHKKYSANATAKESAANLSEQLKSLCVTSHDAIKKTVTLDLDVGTK